MTGFLPSSIDKLAMFRRDRLPGSTDGSNLPGPTHEILPQRDSVMVARHIGHDALSARLTAPWVFGSPSFATTS